MVAHSLYEDPPEGRGDEEIFGELLAGSDFTLERIVSYGQASPPGFWYDQEREEWVLLARGEAILEFEGADSLTLAAGDYAVIPAHCRHRVASVSQDAVWLALHFR